MNRPHPATEVRAFGTHHVGSSEQRGQRTVAELRTELDTIESQFASDQAVIDQRDAEDEERHQQGIERLRRLAAVAKSHTDTGEWTGEPERR